MLGDFSSLRMNVSRRSAAASKQTAIIALVIANVIWGTTFVVTKPILEHFPPVTLATGRFAIALALLLPILALTGRRPILNRATAMLGFTGVFLVYVFQNVGLQYTDAANGALIHGGIPVFTALLAVPVLGEEMPRRGLVGLGLSLTGVAAVVLGGGQGFGPSTFGDLLILVSAFALAAYFTLGRRAFPAGSSVELVAGVAVFGVLGLFPVSIGELSVRGVRTPSGTDWAGLIYLGAAASGLAFLLLAHGLRHLPAAQAAVFTNLNPLVGLLVSVAVLGEDVSRIQLLGGASIVAGVWMAVKHQGTDAKATIGASYEPDHPAVRPIAGVDPLPPDVSHA